MKYLGGKNKIGKELACIFDKIVNNNDVDGYLEPFCGSLGVFKRVIPYNYKKYIAADVHEDLIKLWKELQNDTLKLPKKITEKDYIKLKNSNESSSLRAVVGFGLSFGGKFFNGYSQKYSANSGRDFYQEMKRALDKIKPIIQKSNISFVNKSYDNFNPDNMLVYCDPPYEDTTKYKSTNDFDSDKFWETMRKWSKNNYVFISEEKAPKDFLCIWTKSRNRSTSLKNREYKLEKLFVYKYGKVKVNSKNKKTIKKCKNVIRKTKKK
jgi:DNA adenine methylase